MIDQETTVEIARPVEEVFAFVADQTHAPQWQAGLHEVRRLTEGPVGVGTEHEFVHSGVADQPLQRSTSNASTGPVGGRASPRARLRSGVGNRAPDLERAARGRQRQAGHADAGQRRPGADPDRGCGDQAIRRAVEWGAGWTMAGSTPDMAAEGADRVRTAWREAGRSGEPRVAVLAYFSLGAGTEGDSRGHLRDYYGWLGDFADQIADGALRSEEAVAGAVKAFADAGVSELYFDPTVSSFDQVDRLAEVVLA